MSTRPTMTCYRVTVTLPEAGSVSWPCTSTHTFPSELAAALAKRGFEDVEGVHRHGDAVVRVQDEFATSRESASATADEIADDVLLAIAEITSWTEDAEAEGSGTG